LAYSSGGGVENLRQTGNAFSLVEKSVSPSVVFIKVEGKKSVQRANPLLPFDDDFFKHFFRKPFPGFPYNDEIPQKQYRSIGQ